MLNIDVHGTTPAEPDVEKDWLASHYPLLSEDGAVLGISVVVQDITERKRAEQKVRDSEERLRIMADTLPALFAYVDSEQRYRFMNAAYEKQKSHSPKARNDCANSSSRPRSFRGRRTERLGSSPMWDLKRSRSSGTPSTDGMKPTSGPSISIPKTGGAPSNSARLLHKCPKSTSSNIA